MEKVGGWTRRKASKPINHLGNAPSTHSIHPNPPCKKLCRPKKKNRPATSMQNLVVRGKLSSASKMSVAKATRLVFLPGAHEAEEVSCWEGLGGWVGWVVGWVGKGTYQEGGEEAFRLDNVSAVAATAAAAFLHFTGLWLVLVGWWVLHLDSPHGWGGTRRGWVGGEREDGGDGWLFFWAGGRPRGGERGQAGGACLPLCVCVCVGLGGVGVSCGVSLWGRDQVVFVFQRRVGGEGGRVLAGPKAAALPHQDTATKGRKGKRSGWAGMPPTQTQNHGRMPCFGDQLGPTHLSPTSLMPQAPASASKDTPPQTVRGVLFLHLQQTTLYPHTTIH